MRSFQEYQDKAFAASAKLFLLLAVAILGTVLLSGTALTYLLSVFLYFEGIPPEEHWGFLSVVFSITCTFVAIIVGVGTGLKLLQLREGGSVIARELGGRPIEPENDPKERQLLNVVEEISIASGVSTPEVYILSGEPSINAFAAGYHRNEAVIGVTKGAIQSLTRDEMQGVIAHEFSHILNGDMRLNLRMVGWLHGVLAITIVSHRMIQTGMAWNAADLRRERSGTLLIALGAVLWCVGTIGALMALLIKSAANRQREFLADAYAVQFTRHPQALADAFKRLAGHANGSRVRNPNAIEASHLFLAQGCGRGFTSLLSSHPPLHERILRLDPNWDGVPSYQEPEEDEPNVDEVLGIQAAAVPSASNSSQERIEELEQDGYRSEILDELPKELTQIAALPDGAGLMATALWHVASDSDAEEIESQGSHLRPMTSILVAASAAQRLALLDSAFESMSASQTHELKGLLENKSDGNFFQWMFAATLANLGEEAEVPAVRHARLQDVGKAVEYALSYFCHAGNSASMAAFAFQRGLASLGLEHARFLEAEEMEWEQFEAAVGVLSELAPVPKRRVLLAFAATISADQKVEEDEAFLLRGLCLELGFAPSRLLVGQPMAPGL